MTEFGEGKKPPQFSQVEVGRIYDSLGREHIISFGDTPELIAKLVERSREDPAVRKYTSDPERFSSADAFSAWHEQDRAVLWMTHESELSGMAFFGSKTAPFNIALPVFSRRPHTMGIRVYDEYAGHGAGSQLMREAHTAYLDHLTIPGEGPDMLWLETHKDNPAYTMYQRFGYTTYAYTDGSAYMFLPLEGQDVYDGFLARTYS